MATDFAVITKLYQKCVRSANRKVYHVESCLSVCLSVCLSAFQLSSCILPTTAVQIRAVKQNTYHLRIKLLLNEASNCHHLLFAIKYKGIEQNSSCKLHVNCM